MNTDLFNAILAMDSYNRGYNAGIVFGSDTTNSTDAAGTQIGSVTVYDSDGDAAAKAAGFYAIAYQESSGAVTISYRGTDSILGTGTYSFTDADPLTGWGGGAGLTDTPQSVLAIAFYQIVAACAKSRGQSNLKKINSQSMPSIFSFPF
jgi:hypothetical protein